MPNAPRAPSSGMRAGPGPVPGQPVAQDCGNRGDAAASIEALNRTCYCLSLDEAALRRSLEADLGMRGLSLAMAATHPHLFASVPMFGLT